MSRDSQTPTRCPVRILGNWCFTGLAAGTYTVRIVPVAGISTTTPSGGVMTITVAAGQKSTGNLFGERAS